MSVEEVAYAAGLFDGEGCVIFVRRADSGWQTELTLSNCDIRSLNYMQDLFGGSVRMASISRGENRYPIGMWQISGDASRQAAEAMIPFSILKRRQLELFVEGRKTIRSRGGSRTLSGTDHAKRQRIASEIKSLKRPQLSVAS